MLIAYEGHVKASGRQSSADSWWDCHARLHSACEEQVWTCYTPPHSTLVAVINRLCVIKCVWEDWDLK